jgi:hypothetical protein
MQRPLHVQGRHLRSLLSSHSSSCSSSACDNNNTLQLTDVDPPYGKAPAVAIAEKLEVEGPVGDLLVETKELLKDTQVSDG